MASVLLEVVNIMKLVEKDGGYTTGHEKKACVLHAVSELLLEMTHTELKFIDNFIDIVCMISNDKALVKGINSWSCWDRLCCRK